MLEKIVYKNHLNETFNFGTNGVYINHNELHDYAWTITQKNNRIAYLDRYVVTKKLPVVFICKTKEAGIQARNRLFEVIEKDVLSMKQGKLIIGDYYYKCYITASMKKDYLIDQRYMKVTLSVSSDSPFWVKENTGIFRQNDTISESGLDFPFEFAFDYTSVLRNKVMNNTSVVSSDFKMIIYGACVSPSVYIADHEYTVNCIVETGEYLTIDSINKTVTLTQRDGTIVNKFNDRKKDSYIFEKIPSGNNIVLWDGDFGIDLTIFEKRSEPLWI